MPLARRSPTGQQRERVLIVDPLGGRSRDVDDEPGAAVGRDEMHTGRGGVGMRFEPDAQRAERVLLSADAILDDALHAIAGVAFVVPDDDGSARRRIVHCVVRHF